MAGEGVTLTVGLPNFGPWAGGDWRGFIDVARAADAAGVDRVVLNDHVVMGRHTENYAWGRFPVPPEAPWLEPMTTLAAIAAVTSRVRLGTNILIAPLRPAALLAKTVATLDVLSAGRVDLGVGVGWQQEEYDAQGLAFADRGRRLTDTVAACRALWTHLPADFSSTSLEFTDIFCAPQPVQQRLPVWFGGTLNNRNLERIRRLGDGWIPIMGATVDDIRDGAQRLRAAVTDRPLIVQAPMLLAKAADGTRDITASVASVPELVAAGVNDIYANLVAFCPEPSVADAVLQRLVREFAAVSR